MPNLGLFSILSRSVSCETGYIRRYIYVIKSIAYFLVGKHFFVTPRIFIKRLIHSTKNDNKRIALIACEFKNNGYIKSSILRFVSATISLIANDFLFLLGLWRIYFR